MACHIPSLEKLRPTLREMPLPILLCWRVLKTLQLWSELWAPHMVPMAASHTCTLIEWTVWTSCTLIEALTTMQSMQESELPHSVYTELQAFVWSYGTECGRGGWDNVRAHVVWLPFHGIVHNGIQEVYGSSRLATALVRTFAAPALPIQLLNINRCRAHSLVL